MSDVLAKRAAMQGFPSHAKRALVCSGCLKEDDEELGPVHCERECSRCGKKPMGYGAVVVAKVWT
jgi:hypothetical protein